ncbi:hypothetical protein BJ875DRAFT_475317 [Amylocarpus encephaloides]|uniref:Uncharacterized protein n=1 Tax=Amylocarpus encephaloides TaxID=45428 RepID=A0A9P7YA67_9HELO|nr:hypothetical protein BJ875DRAFT_475317 [Amylocarpus encephaloides]
MFSTTLRRRKQWDTLPATLLASQGPKWQEKSLDTCDILLPLPRRREGDEQRFFRLLLLSAADIETPAPAMPMIERLHHQTGGEQVGIVFLLQEKAPGSSGIIAYMDLQTSLIGVFDMPILPLHSLSSFQNSLNKFWQQLAAGSSNTNANSGLNPAITLLPYCALNPPLPEHPRNVLSEACHSLAEVSQAATIRDGQRGLRSLLSESNSAAAEDVIGFWEQEYMA